MTDPALYRCEYCGATKPVPSLARRCEAAHEADTDPEPEENP